MVISKTQKWAAWLTIGAGLCTVLGFGVAHIPFVWAHEHDKIEAKSQQNFKALSSMACNTSIMQHQAQIIKLEDSIHAMKAYEKEMDSNYISLRKEHLARMKESLSHVRVQCVKWTK